MVLVGVSQTLIIKKVLKIDDFPIKKRKEKCFHPHPISFILNIYWQRVRYPFAVISIASSTYFVASESSHYFLGLVKYNAFL